MTIVDGLKRFWREQPISRIRIISKKKLAERRAARDLARLEERIQLDEVQVMLTGMGLEPSNSQEEDEETDPRFLDNPIGEGSSKSFERTPTRTTSSETTSFRPTSRFRTNSTESEDEEEHFPYTPKEPESVFDPGTWKGPDILRVDWAKDKRKERASITVDEEVRQAKDWLKYLAAKDARSDGSQNEWRRRKLNAVARGRAWTY